MVRYPKIIEVTLPPFAALFDSLPLEQQTGTVQKALQNAYRTELATLLAYALSSACQAPRLVMRDGRLAGTQWICEFWVEDAARQVPPDYNWHGQDTSRWLYGGAMVVENGEVTTHH